MSPEAAESYKEALNRDLLAKIERQNKHSACSMSIVTKDELMDALSRFRSDGENRD